MNKSNIVEANISANGTGRVGHYLRTVSFDRFYRVWSVVHGAIIIALSALAEFSSFRPVALGLLGGWFLLALGGIFVVARAIHPDGSGPALPNILTTSRLVCAILFLGLLLVATWGANLLVTARGSAGWFLVLGLLVVEATDFFDGRIARRLNAGAFGAIWDMENDVVYVVALTIALRQIHGLGLFVLLIGLMRPLYVLFWRYESVPADPPRIYRLFAKTVTALMMTILVLAMIPSLDPSVRTVGVASILALQVISFGWDLTLQRRGAAPAA